MSPVLCCIPLNPAACCSSAVAVCPAAGHGLSRSTTGQHTAVLPRGRQRGHAAGASSPRDRALQPRSHNSAAATTHNIRGPGMQRPAHAGGTRPATGAPGGDAAVASRPPALCCRPMSESGRAPGRDAAVASRPRRVRLSRPGRGRRRLRPPLAGRRPLHAAHGIGLTRPCIIRVTLSCDPSHPVV